MPVTSPAKSQAKPSILRDEVEPEGGHPFGLVADDAARRHRRIGGPHEGEPDQGGRAGQPRRGVACVGGQQPGDDRPDEGETDGGDEQQGVWHGPLRLSVARHGNHMFTGKAVGCECLRVEN